MKKLLLALLLVTAPFAIAQSPSNQGVPAYIKPVKTPDGTQAASLIAKPFPATLYSVTVTDTAAEYILIMDSATLPADGTVTLIVPPIKVSANTTTMVTFNMPSFGSKGIVVCNSSTSPSKTIGGNTCQFSVQAR